MVLGKSLLKPSHHFNLTGSWQGREYPGIFLLVARESLKIAKIIYSNGMSLVQLLMSVGFLLNLKAEQN